MAEGFEDTYHVIVQYWLEHGYGPSIRDVMTLTGSTSTSVTTYRINRLIERGQLVEVPGLPRTLRPVNYGRHWKNGKLAP